MQVCLWVEVHLLDVPGHHGLDEPERDTLYYHINHAEFAVGDFELAYRMHQRAGRAITAVIEGNVAEEVRNQAIFRLARMSARSSVFARSM